MNVARQVRQVVAICIVSILAIATAQSTVTIGLNADARTLDPLSNRDTTTSLVLRNIYESLFDWGQADTTGQMLPLLAESYEWDGALTWLVTLRQGIEFHNGEPFNAEAVVATFNYVMNPDNQALTRSRIEPIASVSEVDEFTVKFETHEPHAIMLQSLQAIMIVPASILESDGVSTLVNSPVGTGPYQLAKWDREQRILLKRNEGYHEGVPAIEYAEFIVMPDINSRVAALLAGELDLVYNLPPQVIETVSNNPGVELRAAAPGRRVMFIGLDNISGGPLQDVRVRQALNYAIDVELFIAAILEGHGTQVAGALVPQNQHLDTALVPYPYDPERARELLAEAGYADGLSLVLHSPQGRYLKDVEVAQALATQLQEVGVTIDLQVHEWGNFLARLEARTLSDMYLNGRPDLELDGSILRNFFLTGQPYVAFSDSNIDASLEAASVLVAPEERARAYTELQAQIQEAAPWIFLWAQHDLYGVNSDLNWLPRDDEQILVRFASFD